MKSTEKRLIGITSTLFISVGLFGPMSAVAAESKGPEKFALVIGIDDYINGIPGRRPDGNPGGDLSGCVNDANSIEEMLIGKNFPKDHITKLLNEHATRQEILKAFDELVEKVEKNPNSIVVFSYAGHGGQTRDLDGDEEDGMDETLIPADVAMNDKGDKSIPDITDDEIEQRFRRMAKATKNITFILDSCHSGTGTREITKTAKNARVRQLVENKLRPHHDMTPSPENKRGNRSDSINAMLAQSTDYVTISGCRSDQQSGETLTEPSHGVMTSSLLDAIKGAPERATYRQIYEDTRDRALKNPGGHSVKNGPQEPQIEGDLDRVFLGESGNRGDRSFRVLDVNGQSVTIPVGLSGAVAEGTQVALYDQKETNLVGKKGLLATAKIKSVGPTSSTFDLKKDFDPEKIKRAQVVIVTPNFGGKSLQIALDSGSNKKFSDSFQAQLKDNPILKLSEISQNPFSNESISNWKLCVTNRKYSDFLKVLPKGDEPLTKTGTNAPKNDEIVSYVALRSQAPLYNFCVSTKDTDSSEDLIKLLEKKVKQDNLVDLANATSELNDKIKISVLNDKNIEFPQDNDGVHISKGTKYKFKVQNDSSLDVYITVLIVGTRGGITVVYDGKDKLNSGDSFSTRMVTASGPFGKDTYKFIVTTKKAPFDFLEQDGYDERSKRENRSSNREIGTSPLVGLLESNLGFTKTRDIDNPGSDPEPDEWDAISRNIFVERSAGKATEASIP
ncbi:caspase family protein [Candidatus Obscuribacterales bacterium]|nr:caspase family protein [Candidatus Obscuribacterales bacterium]